MIRDGIVEVFDALIDDLDRNAPISAIGTDQFSNLGRYFGRGKILVDPLDVVNKYGLGFLQGLPALDRNLLGGLRCWAKPCITHGSILSVLFRPSLTRFPAKNEFYKI